MTNDTGHIRPATLDDVPSITACAVAAYEMYVERIGKIPAPMQANFTEQLQTHSIDVIAHNETLMGYVVHKDQGHQTLLENVAVFPQFAGRGYGRMLIDHVEQCAAASNSGKVVLYTNEAMTENLSLYPKLGYEETGKVVEDGFKRVYFRKQV